MEKCRPALERELTLSRQSRREGFVARFLSASFGDKPYNQAYYQQNQDNSDPNTGLEDVSNDLTAGYDRRKKEQRER